MWSKKPTPVEMSNAPEPSRSTETEISVSLVYRPISARRGEVLVMSAFP
jgi:hypothetical protein